MFKNIKKRDGRVVEFDPSKITSAVAKAGRLGGRAHTQAGGKNRNEYTKHNLAHFLL